MEIWVVFELRGRFYVTVCSFLADTIKKYNLWPRNCKLFHVHSISLAWVTSAGSFRERWKFQGAITTRLDVEVRLDIIFQTFKPVIKAQDILRLLYNWYVFLYLAWQLPALLKLRLPSLRMTYQGHHFNHLLRSTLCQSFDGGSTVVLLQLLVHRKKVN